MEHIEVIHQPGRGETTHETPVLFIHGAWHGAWCWEPTFIPYFIEKGYDTYALSLRGHGNSSGQVRFARANDYLSDIRRVVSEIKPHPILIGHSMGGYLVQRYLERYAHEVPAAVLLAAAPINGALPMNLRLLFTYPLHIFRVLAQLDPGALIKEPEMMQKLFFSDDYPLAELREHHARMGSESIRVNFEMAVRPPAAQRYDLPMLVLGGIHDTLFTREEIRMTARVYGTEAEFFNMAHDMMLEPGALAVADRIVQWLVAQNV